MHEKEAAEGEFIAQNMAKIFDCNHMNLLAQVT
jgi:hypothetical protein